MSDKETLIALAERVEAASGPEPELDFLVWAALNGVTEITNPAEGHPMTPGKGGRVEGRGPDGKWHLYGWVDPGKVQRNWTPYGGDAAYPAVTASLDAAMTLVPEGWRTTVHHETEIFGNPPFVWRLGEKNAAFGRAKTANGDAATPALALTAAALRARAVQS